MCSQFHLINSIESIIITKSTIRILINIRRLQSHHHHNLVCSGRRSRCFLTKKEKPTVRLLDDFLAHLFTSFPCCVQVLCGDVVHGAPRGKKSVLKPVEIKKCQNRKRNIEVQKSVKPEGDICRAVAQHCIYLGACAEIIFK